jgi:hypothetical protein
MLGSVSYRAPLALVALATAVGAGSPTVSAEAGAAPFRGALHGTADTLGRVTLSFEGKRATRLRAGRYTIVVVDRASRSGFILNRPNFTQVVVTTSPFVGRRTRTVALTPGSWSYQGAVGGLHGFTVVT